MHSPFVKQILNLWTTENRIIPEDCKDSKTAILEAGPHNGAYGRKRRLESQNNETTVLVVVIVPKISFWMKVNMLNKESSRITPWCYTV